MNRIWTPLPLAVLCWSLTAVAHGASADSGEAGGGESAPSEERLPEARGVVASNRYFHVFADESLSAKYVAMIGELFARQFSRLVPPPSGSQPVLVSLVPESDGTMNSDFLTRIHPGGQVRLYVSWGESTRRETLERALVQAHLTYLSGRYSETTAVHVPLWLELAGQHFAHAEALPTHVRYLGRRMAEAETMSPERILTARRGEVEERSFGVQAYWWFRFLEKSSRRDQFRHFLIRNLGGEDPIEALEATYGSAFRSLEEARVWWLVGVTHLLESSGSSPMKSADESERRVRELSTFLFATDRGEVRLFPEDLWEHRESATLRDELQRQRTLVRLASGTVHPYYHNALVSLDRVFQSISGEDESAYREALVAFRQDLGAGEELAEETRTVLDDLSAALAESADP